MPQGGRGKRQEERTKKRSIMDIIDSMAVAYKTDDDGPLLPPKDPKDTRPTLVLDMDETLICAKFDMCVNGSDIIIPVRYSSMTGTGLSSADLYTICFVKKRPFLDEFLEAVAKDWEVVIFTAGVDDYANPILDSIDPHHRISYRLFRSSCSCDKVEGGVYKNLSILGRDLNRVIIVDNSPNAYRKHVSNAIPIVTWENDGRDRALVRLMPVLHELSQEGNVVRALGGMNLGTF